MARRRVRRTSIASFLIVALIAAASAPLAHADGDPASDYLLTSQVFATSQTQTLSPAQRQLLAVVRAANRAGLQIRVAIISSEYDMGSIIALWRKPAIYARFLGIELSSVYRGRLLVVMPNGFGFNWPGHRAGPSGRLLTGVSLGAPGDGLAVSAQAAVRQLATASGVKLAAISSPGAARSGGTHVLVIVGAVVLALALLFAVAVVVLPRARRRVATRRAKPRPASAGRAVPFGIRVAIPGVALVFAAAVVIPMLVRRGNGVSSATAASVVTPPPFSWPAGNRAAPDFVLRDQAGRSVSIAAYRGHPVIITFIDPLCRNLCPLEAQVLNQVVREVPASERPVILAVSVDVYASTRADLLKDVRVWHLVPQWQWAVGRPKQLAAVWSSFKIGVSVVTKRIAGTTIHYITHTEAAYVIDGTGHERALFLWPFYPQDVKRVLAQLA